MPRRPIPPMLPRLVLAAALAIAGCTRHEGDVVRVVAIDHGASPASASASPASVGDRRLPLPAALVRGATAEGLVACDADGHVVPAIADRWMVTDGGLAYIFRLRDGTWPDGSAITGESARAALREAIAQQAGTPVALDLAPLGEIRAMAGRVIELRLASPMPDLLMLLAQPELGLVHRGKGAGPMSQKRTAATLRLAMIAPAKRGLPQPDGWAAGVRPLDFTTQPADRAIAGFAAGQSDLVLGGGFADLPRLAHAGLPAASLRFDTVGGLFGLLVVRSDGFLATAQAREALAMAIDRDGLATALGAPGWVPGTRVVSPGLDGDPGLVGERWADIDLDGRRTLAARRVNFWIASGGAPIVLRVALPAGPGADVLFDRLSSDFLEIGIALRRADAGDPPDLRLVDSAARWPQAEWFLDRLSCAALAGPCSPEADALAAQARHEADPIAAARDRAEAENALAASNVFIPFGPPVRWSLVRAGLAGFAVNRPGWHPLAPLALRVAGP